MSSQDAQPQISSAQMWRDGDRLLFSGKGGEIQYSGHGHTFLIGFELASSGILIYLPPRLGEISEEYRVLVERELTNWLAEMGFIATAEEILEEEVNALPCMHKRCERPRLKDRYICRYHYLEQVPNFELTRHYLPAPDSRLDA